MFLVPDINTPDESVVLLCAPFTNVFKEVELVFDSPVIITWLEPNELLVLPKTFVFVEPVSLFPNPPITLFELFDKRLPVPTVSELLVASLSVNSSPNEADEVQEVRVLL